MLLIVPDGDAVTVTSVFLRTSRYNGGWFHGSSPLQSVHYLVLLCQSCTLLSLAPNNKVHAGIQNRDGLTLFVTQECNIAPQSTAPRIK